MFWWNLSQWYLDCSQELDNSQQRIYYLLLLHDKMLNVSMVHEFQVENLKAILEVEVSGSEAQDVRKMFRQGWIRDKHQRSTIFCEHNVVWAGMVQTNVPLMQQQIMFQGQEVLNSTRLDAAGVRDNDMLMLVSTSTTSTYFSSHLWLNSLIIVTFLLLMYGLCYHWRKPNTQMTALWLVVWT